MGTVDRCARRKYHGLLTVREPGVGEPLNVVAEVEEWFMIGDKSVALQSYDWGSTVEPKGFEHLVRFEPEPRWTYRFEGLTVTRELWLEAGADVAWLRYTIEGVEAPVKLHLRPMLRYRPQHDLTVANPFLNGRVEVKDDGFLQAKMVPYRGLPPLTMSLHGADGVFHADGHWYEGVHYPWEQERGYDHAEDLFTPGEFRLVLTEDGAWNLRLGTTDVKNPEPQFLTSVATAGPSFVQELTDAADAYLVRVDGDRTGVIAGYPWFGEWSRDALISLPGLCLERGRVQDAVAILDSLAARLEDGLIPNLPRSGGVPANANAIDASLLFIWATALTSKRTRSGQLAALQTTCLGLVEALLDDADPRIRIDEDGFIFINPGPWALTWMDAMIGADPVTPRWGYAVDLNALWLFGLLTAAGWAKRHRPELEERIEETARKLADHFEEKFWIQDLRFLTDVHDGERQDRKLRPNQLWALSLPGIPLAKARKRSALQAVRQNLLTPVGLRTLSPDDPDYRPAYAGTQAERDLAYHQGTVWPWLLGPYADAVRSIEGPIAVRNEMLPMLASLSNHLRTEGCIGQIGEVFDAEAPHRPGGAPAQAWSVAEVLRVAKMAGP